MLRFLQVIVCNLPRIYMIPRMAYKARHGEKYSEEECYRYAQLAIRRMMKAGHISTRKYGTEHLPQWVVICCFPTIRANMMRSVSCMLMKNHVRW